MDARPLPIQCVQLITQARVGPNNPFGLEETSQYSVVVVFFAKIKASALDTSLETLKAILGANLLRQGAPARFPDDDPISNFLGRMPLCFGFGPPKKVPASRKDEPPQTDQSLVPATHRTDRSACMCTKGSEAQRRQI